MSVTVLSKISRQLYVLSYASDLSLPQDVKRDVESAWEKVVALVNGSCHSDSLESRFFPFFDESSTNLLYDEGK